MAVTSRFEESRLVTKCGNFNGCVGKSAEGYRNVHGGYGCGRRN